jgi:hypothetical protein
MIYLKLITLTAVVAMFGLMYYLPYVVAWAGAVTLTAVVMCAVFAINPRDEQ